MRFLNDDELPQRERDRRAEIREVITWLEECERNTWKHVEPELRRFVLEGRYDAEAALRHRTYRETAKLREEIQELQRELPPHMEMTDDGWHIRVP